MRLSHAQEDLQMILSWFSGAFSRPSFKLFSTFILGFIQLGKEAHTSAMVRLLSVPWLERSLSSFTRFLGKHAWTIEDLTQTAVARFFTTLRIKTKATLFLVADDTLVSKTGKKMPGCVWYKDPVHQRNLFGHQWVLSVLLYQDFLLPLGAKLYHRQGSRGCGPFQSKITLVKNLLRTLHLPVPCNLYLLVDSWYWAKTLARGCRRRGAQMIAQLKSNAVVWIQGTRTKINTLTPLSATVPELALFVYGKHKQLKLHKWIVTLPELGNVALVVVQQKRKKPYYLICTDLELAAHTVVLYYAKRWKIEQLIKDCKQRLGFGDYQVRDLVSIQRHVALVLLSYGILTFLKLLQWFRDKQFPFTISMRLVASSVRKYVIVKNITLVLNKMQVQFQQHLLEHYFEPLWA